MEQLPRAIVIAAIILAGGLVVRGLYPADRYTMVPVQGGAYRLDRLTGSVLFCDAIVCRELPLAAFRAGAAPAPKSAASPAAGATGT
jgi:hypothetical protein